MDRIKKTILAALAVIGLLIGFSSNSEAAPYFAIQVSDGTNSLLIQDNLNYQDLDPRSGIIDWSGSVGDWNIKVQVTQTFDMLGNASAPRIDLASANNPTAAGTLTIDVSEVGLLASAANFTSAQVGIGGTTLPNGSGTITAQLFGGNSNVLLDKSNFIVSTEPLAGNAAGVFGGSAIGGFTPSAGNFSLTSEVVIHHDVAGLATFNNNAVAVPEPSTLIFLGSCLLGAGMVSRKVKI